MFSGVLWVDVVPCVCVCVGVFVYDEESVLLCVGAYCIYVLSCAGVYRMCGCVTRCVGVYGSVRE